MNTIHDILNSRNRVLLSFKGESIKDALQFGFGYLEHEDHMVHYIAANPKVMKKILMEVPDASLTLPHGSRIGNLWTAQLILSEKLNDDQVLFSNEVFSAVIDLNLNPYMET